MNKDKIDKIAAKIEKMVEEQKKVLRNELEPAFREVFDDYFAKHPEVEAIKFRAYTPYFNDGDTCTFSVGEADLKFNTPIDNEDTEYVVVGKEPDLDRRNKPRTDSKGNVLMRDKKEPRKITVQLEVDHWYDCYELDDANGEKYSLDEINSLLDQSENMIELVYGDHVEVTISRAGIESEEYVDHD